MLDGAVWSVGHELTPLSLYLSLRHGRNTLGYVWHEKDCESGGILADRVQTLFSFSLPLSLVWLADWLAVPVPGPCSLVAACSLVAWQAQRVLRFKTTTLHCAPPTPFGSLQLGRSRIIDQPTTWWPHPAPRRRGVHSSIHIPIHTNIPIHIHTHTHIHIVSLPRSAALPPPRRRRRSCHGHSRFHRHRRSMLWTVVPELVFRTTAVTIVILCASDGCS